MIILYNASSDWSRQSHERSNKTSCLPGNEYHIPLLRKPQDISCKCYEKTEMNNRCKQRIINKSKIILDNSNFYLNKKSKSSIYDLNSCCWLKKDEKKNY